MKRNKIVLAASAVVLTAASALAGRASVKLNAPALYYTGGSRITCQTLESSITSTSLLTTGGTGKQATITTQGSGATQMNLYADNACSVKVRFHG